MESKIEENKWFWLLKVVAMPLTLLGVGFIGKCGSERVANSFNKATLLKEFKEDILSPENGPRFAFARESLKDYFSREEWNSLVSEISKSNFNLLGEVLNSNDTKPYSHEPFDKALGAVNTLLKYDRSAALNLDGIALSMQPAIGKWSSGSPQDKTLPAKATTSPIFLDELQRDLKKKKESDPDFANTLLKFRELNSWINESKK